ncbi:uncharacterized protein Triagg1_2176 [Trichoderma aggressivum f. europaeum]|uniref:Uncharacterized protein n=1 Tax=Trichoderma aggressivum f. europaeum TaxID=173218 RepID=A0AAE1M2G0_9HYPO|nr:hypothetical protein Triagg1_2176 [Trichoderma aggressivum f. europaeum]
MDSKSSNLTNLGCDFVVATTQATINSGLLNFIDQAQQEVKYLCYLVNPTTGELEDPITLEELKKKTGGINPPCQVGIKMQIGIPREADPRDLSIINLGQNAYGVDFNMYYSDITVIENDPVKWGYSDSWNIWEQPRDQPWAASCLVDLLQSNLSRNLDDPYLNSHPDIKFQLMRALDSLPDTNYHLQQLRLAWNDAVPPNDFDFPGMDMKTKAGDCLRSCLFEEYLNFALENAMSPFVVTAFAETFDDGSQSLTAMQRLVNPPRDSSGNPISNPSSSQKAITTLDFICAINNNKLPNISGFNWNWVLPEDVDSKSGVMAIRRGILAQHFLDDFKVSSIKNMYKAVARKEDNNRLQLLNGEWLSDATADLINDDASRVLHIQLGVPPSEPLRSWDGNNGMEIYIGKGIKYAKVDIHPGYSCDIYFEGQEFRVEQRMWITAAVAAEFPHEKGDLSEHKPVDKYLTEKYSLSIDHQGQIKLRKTGSTSADKSDRWHNDGDVDSDNTQAAKDGFFNHLYQMMGEIVPTAMDMEDVFPPNNFIFPGAQPFVYKDVFFSENLDLIAKLMHNYAYEEIISPKGKFEAVNDEEPVSKMITFS